jgi:hypothetical protein
MGTIHGMSPSTSPLKKKFKQQSSLRKIMASIFRDKEGNFLVDFLDKGTTVKSEQNKETLNKL